MGATEIIIAYWPVFVVSFAVALMATPLCRRFALARRIVDLPDDYLKPHAKPVAYLGGVAIFLGWVAGVAVAARICTTADGVAGEATGGLIGFPVMLGIVIAGTLITGLGLLDDIRYVTPTVRLLVTLALGGLLLVCGLGDDFAMAFVRQTGVAVGGDQRWLALVVSAPIALFVTVGACNAVNVLDGLDGLCAGVLTIIHLGFLGLALYLHTRGAWSPGDVRGVVLSLAVCGAALGFLPYNRHPASIFMGDAGSMLLGLNAAILLLLFAETVVLRFALAALVIFTVPVADMSLAMFRRRRAGIPMMRGDRSHFYDQLVDRGYAVPKVAGIAYALAAGYVVLGWGAMVLATPYSVVLCVVTASATVAAVVLAKMVRADGEGRNA